MLTDLEFNGWLNTFWQFNLDLSVIVLTVLLVRFFIRKTTKSYNSYLLWLAIPFGFLIAKIITSIEFTSADSTYIGQAVTAMIVKPVETLQSYWWLGALWLSGTTLLLLRLIIQHIELRRDLKHISRPITSLSGHNWFRSEHYSVIAVEHQEMSPAVYGFIKPKIYFPLHVAKQLSVQQVQLIIQHEEQHIKQKHLWLNLLWDLLVCVGWFNPLIYIARKDFRHDQELYCDYLVLNKTDQSSSKAYGHALLSTVSATHSVSLLCSWKVFNQLEERIMNISKPLNRKGKAALTLGAALVLSCSAIYAANKDAQKDISIHKAHEIYDGDENIKIELNEGDGVVYVRNNDEYLIREDGSERPMTAEEREHFEKAHERAQEELALSVEELEYAEIEIEKAYKELELEQVHQEALKSAHKELEKAHEKIKVEFDKGRLSEEQRDHMRQQLIEAKKTLKIDKERLRADLDRAREEIKKARRDIHAKKIKMSRPPAPPKSAEAAVPPKAANPIISRKTPRPNYPKGARDQGIEGYVLLSFDVNSSGKATNIRVKEDNADGIFNKEAMDSVKNWTFAEKDYGKKDMEYKLKFALDDRGVLE